jgi:hypothetical protein
MSSADSGTRDIFDNFNHDKLALSVAVLTGRVSSTFHGTMQTVSVRIPDAMLWNIEAFTEMSNGQSRNRIINELLEVAIDVVSAKLTEAERETFFALVNKNVQKFLEEHNSGKKFENGKF